MPTSLRIRQFESSANSTECFFYYSFSLACAAGGFFPVRGKETKGRPKEVLWNPGVRNRSMLSLVKCVLRTPMCAIPKP